ncbi:MAG: hypothetical protein ACRDIY_01080 [Chloroflexota bacterium]
MRRVRWLVVGLLMAFLAGTATWFLPGAPGFSPRLTVDGRPYFWAGVNYPYKTSQDFGTNAWGYSGVAQPTTYQEIDTDFANLAASGVRVVKWRVFNDGRADPEFNANGYATGLDSHFYQDLDAALTLARKHGIYLVLTLFNSGFWTTECTQQDVHLGGHADSLVDPAKRQALIDNAIVPLMRHVGSNDRVLAFEIIAEPEWGVVELNHQQDGRLKVPLSDARTFIGQVTAAIHFYTDALATVESNRASNMAQWRGLGLDYYSFSWYDWLQPYEPLDRPAASFHLDRPIVLGEFPSNGSKYYSLSQIYDIALEQGYAGAFAWSYDNPDEYTNWGNVANIFLDWMQAHWQVADLVKTTKPPVSPVDLRPPPYDFQNVKVMGEPDGLWLQAAIRVALPGTYHLQWFLYDASAGPGSANAEQTLSFAGAPLQLTVPLGSLAQGHTYKVSLGVFDQSYHLIKWFDSVAVVQIKGGVPQMQTRMVEDPCGRETGPGAANG